MRWLFSPRFWAVVAVALIAAGLAVAAGSRHARAAAPSEPAGLEVLACGPLARVHAVLVGEAGLRPVGAVVAGDTVMELLAAPDGRWAQLLIRGNPPQACILRAGTGWIAPQPATEDNR